MSYVVFAAGRQVAALAPAVAYGVLGGHVFAPGCIAGGVIAGAPFGARQQRVGGEVLQDAGSGPRAAAAVVAQVDDELFGALLQGGEDFDEVVHDGPVTERVERHVGHVARIPLQLKPLPLVFLRVQGVGIYRLQDFVCKVELQGLFVRREQLYVVGLSAQALQHERHGHVAAYVVGGRREERQDVLLKVGLRGQAVDFHDFRADGNPLPVQLVDTRNDGLAFNVGNVPLQLVEKGGDAGIVVPHDVGVAVLQQGAEAAHFVVEGPVVGCLLHLGQVGAVEAVPSGFAYLVEIYEIVFHFRPEFGEDIRFFVRGERLVLFVRLLAPGCQGQATQREGKTGTAQRV